MTILYIISSVSIAFSAMEFVAWFTHKYVMHGFMWKVHEDHHVPHSGIFEKNDLFFLIYAIPSSLCIIFGLINQSWVIFGIGFGIALYGVAYFLIHDVLIHRRFKWFDKTNNVYFKAIRKAHKVHHKKRWREDGECFGLLIVPRKYIIEQKRNR